MVLLAAALAISSEDGNFLPDLEPKLVEKVSIEGVKDTDVTVGGSIGGDGSTLNP